MSRFIRSLGGIVVAQVLLPLLFCAPAQAEPLQIDASTPELSLRERHLQLLEEPRPNFSPELAEQAWLEQRTIPATVLGLNLGLVSSAYWARFELENASSEPVHRLLVHRYTPIDSLYLYQGNGSSFSPPQIAGDSPAITGGPRTRLSAFTITLPANTSQVYWLRIESPRSNLSLNLDLWHSADFQRAENRVHLAYGMLFGLVGITVIYLLLAWWSLRTRTPLVLAAYLACYLLYLAFLNGFLNPWVPRQPLQLLNNLHLASLGLLYGFGAMFYRDFLRLEQYNPGANRVLIALQWLSFGIAASAWLPIVVIALLLFLVATLGPIITLGFAAVLWHRKRAYAAVFTLGWALAHASSLAGSLRIVGVLPNTDALLHLPALGCATAVLFFVWAIGRQIAQEHGMAYTDYLTGLANRRQFFTQGERDIDRCLRYNRRLALILIDIDFFKQINDNHGHSQGDKVLQHIATYCRRHVRESDLVARIGGEEFAILLQENDGTTAANTAERLRSSLEDSRPENIPVTISVGVAQLGSGPETLEQLMERADRALYQAKSEGRNRVITAV
jgi:diguanylate cyclase (GGDEF)-like protein